MKTATAAAQKQHIKTTRSRRLLLKPLEHVTEILLLPSQFNCYHFLIAVRNTRGSMKPTEIKLNPVDRRSQKRIAKRVFVRLILADQNFNQKADSLRTAIYPVVVLASIVFGYIISSIGFPALLGLLTQIEGCPPQIITLLDFIAAKPLVFGTLPAAVFIISGLLYFGSLQRSGRLVLLLIKISGSGKNKKKLLDIVEGWLRQSPEQVRNAHILAYKKEPIDLFPDKVREVLKQRQKTPGDQGTIIIRNFAERKYQLLYILKWFQPPNDEKFRKAIFEDQYTGYYRNARGYRNAIRVSLLFDALGAELRDETLAGNKWRRNYVTNFERQQTTLIDHEDLPPRFKTGAAHYRWPDPSRDSSINETALFRVIMGLENPMLAPVYTISAKDVVAAFPEAVVRLHPNEFSSDSDESRQMCQQRADEAIELLKQEPIGLYEQRGQSTLQPTSEGGVEQSPLLRDLNDGSLDEEGTPLPPDWALKWDPNRINWSDLDSSGRTKELAALAILAGAINIVSEKATPIRLRRGDIALIDNLRCLVGRREWGEHGVWWKQVFKYPDRWWLRGYYGFRRSRASDDIYGGS
ncbi:MAG: hypothetical protein AAF720_09970 [Pseudomonadota bacterium]